MPDVCWGWGRGEYFTLYRFFSAERSSIPDWARGKTLAKILDRQYGGPNPLNPDKIFSEFFTCNLEHIFNTKKSKWDRNSRWGFTRSYRDMITMA